MRYYFIVFIFYELLISFYFYSQYSNKVYEINQNKIKLLEHTFDTTINTFELSHDDFHSVQSYNMAKIVSKTNGASKETRDKAREELLNKFTTFYTTKKLQSLEGMHIFDKDGRSLLRFHRIDKHDDNIMELRKSLQNMSKNFSYQKGMEVGRYKESYRFQYPLFYDGEFVGSYEYSVSFRALQEEMQKFFAQQYVLLLNASEVDRVLVDYAKEKRYIKYLVGDTLYYFQKNLFDSKKGMENFEKVLGLYRVHKILNSGTSGVVDVFIGGEMYDIVIKPMLDTSSRDIGFLIAIEKNEHLSELKNALFMDILLSTLLSLSIFIFIIKQIKNKNYVRELINVQKDMLIVSDGTGIKDANSTMLEFFGYKSLNDFLKEHSCVCDFFVKEDGFLEEEIDGKYWINYIKESENKEHKVKIKDRKTSQYRVFNVEHTLLKMTNSLFIVFKDITQEYEEYKKLKNRANYDSLTNIYNRGSFEYYLESQIKKAYKTGNVFSLIMFDIDYFKKINDTYGHDVGDIILKELTLLVSSHIRESDIFARWGGEEFMIISMNSLEHSEILSEKIRKVIENNNFSIVKDVTCSFGVSQYNVGDTKDTIIKRSDNMLYSAKENGRNKVVSIR